MKGKGVEVNGRKRGKIKKRKKEKNFF